MDEVFNKMKKIIADKLEVDEDMVTMDSSFRDLGVDSLGTYELIYIAEEEMGIEIPEEKANAFRTVRDAYNFINSQKGSINGGGKDESSSIEQFDSAVKSFNENMKAFKCKGAGTNVDDKLIDQALGYMINKDYKKAIPLFEDAANQGHMGAQYALGEMYYEGNVAEHSFEYDGKLMADGYGMKKAVYWFKKAAEQNHSDAENFLGSIYFNDVFGVARNKTKAKYWYKRAHKHGNDVAFRNLYQNDLSFSDPLLTFLSIVMGSVIGGFAAGFFGFGFLGFVCGFVIGCIIMRILRLKL